MSLSTNKAHEHSLKLGMFFGELALANIKFPKENFRNDAVSDFDQSFSSTDIPRKEQDPQTATLKELN